MEGKRSQEQWIGEEGKWRKKKERSRGEKKKFNCHNSLSIFLFMDWETPIRGKIT